MAQRSEGQLRSGNPLPSSPADGGIYTCTLATEVNALHQPGIVYLGEVQPTLSNRQAISEREATGQRPAAPGQRGQRCRRGANMPTTRNPPGEQAAGGEQAWQGAVACGGSAAYSPLRWQAPPPPKVPIVRFAGQPQKKEAQIL
jgi:hypothetical protein